MSNPDIDIVPIDPLDRDLVNGWIRAQRAVTEHDLPGEPLPSPAFQRLRLLLWPDALNVERYVARRGGDVIGSIQFSMPNKDNQHLLELELDVRPEHRRQGVGTALLEFTERRARELGRDTILAFAVDSLEDGPRFDHSGQEFAKARGFKVVDQEIHRRNDLTLVGDDELGKLYADAWEKAAGYELVQWIDDCPDEIIEGYAGLNERMYTDPPMGEELDIRPAVYDAARVRNNEWTSKERGQTQFASAVVHVETGEVAGMSVVGLVPGEELHAWQEDTIVDEKHRGHRLGMVLKIANQRLLRRYRPQIRYVHTWNAEVNDHMIAINEAMGYRALCRDFDVQKKLA
ncbi:GNAT family N-acetyltransferase [Glycomyces harbinensis]|uniref:Acetyltransferase (GNAT) family protein n=1 Tax=Glycomyces harbinensis TaxID=58114 RepID=A0A1G6UR50_9ACTN|nr:GNAT family N-acetyltransferase [Glycomyces harbinensis]SDD43812.1 Acetyltransferase (GNAT) family protein [Glycomyces harbinensis]